MEYLVCRDLCCLVLFIIDLYFSLNNKSYRYESICVKIVSSDLSDLIFFVSGRVLVKDFKIIKIFK